MAPTKAQVRTKIRFHTQQTHMCFGQLCSHHQGCKIQRSDTLNIKNKIIQTTHLFPRTCRAAAAAAAAAAVS
jgi:hypothetical protein